MSINTNNFRRHSSFIMRYEEWLKSEAYRDLTPLARCLLEEFQRIYRPGRNGQLSISVKNAAILLNVSDNTARKGYRELEEHGFLAFCTASSYMAGRATEYRLTIEPYNGIEPTDDWRDWRLGNPIIRVSRKVPKKQNDTAKSTQDLRNNRAGDPQNLRMVIDNDQ